VLEYLLDEAQSEARVAELTRGFADVMIHQVALVGGIRRGVRAALDRISPDSIVELAKKGGGSFIEALAPAQKRWTLYVEQHRDLAEDEEQLTQVLFGKAFARAYAVIARGGGDSEEEDEPD
jgi:predicted component of type VI protein secretion system